MEEYRLEDHLKECSEKYPRYENLYATWNLNKETCINALKSVSINYTHFSEHDASHSQTIIDKIEMLLGDRIRNLSPTDTWLILHAAYTHDLGMLLKMKDLEEAWKSEEFKEFLEQERNGIDEDLKEAIEAIYNLRESKMDYYDSLKIYRYVNLINQCYFRRKHSNISEQYLTSLGENLKVDLTCNGRINANLFYLLGEICGLHTANENEILKLDYETNGFSTDYAHPRFVAVLLRLGDLLDIDNGRFNPFTALVAGDPPEQTKPHIEKHQSTRHLLITPEKIEFRSNCSSDEAYREIRNTIKWLEKEIEFLTLNWSKIVPKNLGGYAPRFDKKELLLNGIPDIEGTTDLKLQISQEKAFDIIEGYNIYDDKFIFIREVIQNALDATKLKLWQDLKNGIYDFAIGRKEVLEDFSKLEPFDLSEEIYKNYTIEIKLSTSDNGDVKFEIQDRGIGIDVEGFKRMSQVAISNTDYRNLKKDISEMPRWLRPTAGFGIGLQTIYLVADSFKIITNNGIEMLEANINSIKKGGFIKLNRYDEKIRQGTIVEIVLKKDVLKDLKGIRRHIIEEYNNNIDPLDKDTHRYFDEMKLLSKLDINLKNINWFSVKVKSGIVGEKEYCSKIRLDYTKHRIIKNNYIIINKNDYRDVIIWDKITDTYAKFSLDKKNRGESIYLKGIPLLEREYNLKNNRQSIGIDIDFYGLDLKENIQLNRNKLTSKGINKVTNIIRNIYKYYQEYIFENNGEKFIESIGENSDSSIKNLWLFCDIKYKMKFNNNELSNKIANIPIDFFELDDKKNKYVLDREKRKLGEIWPLDKLLNEGEISFISTSNYKYSVMNDPQEVLERLNQIPNDVRKKKLILAKYGMGFVDNLFYKDLYFEENDDLRIFTVYLEDELTDPEKYVINLSIDSKNIMLSYLCEENDNHRYFIPAIDIYKSIAVDLRYNPILSVPGLSYKYYILARAHIISPFTGNQAQKRKIYSKSCFIDEICSLGTFNKCVEFTKKYAVYKDVSIDNIRETYKQLIGDYYDAMDDSYDKQNNLSDSK
ncbi:HD domain-containing protein [Megamonas rupellensis]|uniref:HD domain-containing protein n=1 Tax=Megamonas rupellensis TaxID=491921 RepID=UPI00241FA04F|nr:hypothetical protein [Megamonas rupellensis]